jgi:dihydrofolate reductase
MRRVYLFMMVSLEGYFEGEDHDLSWHNVDAEFNDFAHEQLRETGTLLFGKRTYDLMAGFWPTPQGQADDKEIAATMSALPKVVVSNRPVTPSWQPTKVITANVHDEITKLKLEERQKHRDSREQRALRQSHGGGSRGRIPLDGKSCCDRQGHAALCRTRKTGEAQFRWLACFQKRQRAEPVFKLESTSLKVCAGLVRHSKIRPLDFA